MRGHAGIAAVRRDIAANIAAVCGAVGAMRAGFTADITARVTAGIAALRAAVLRSDIAALVTAVRAVAAALRSDIATFVAAVHVVASAVRTHIAADIAALCHDAKSDQRRARQRPIAVVVRGPDRGRPAGGGQCWRVVVEAAAVSSIRTGSP